MLLLLCDVANFLFDLVLNFFRKPILCDLRDDRISAAKSFEQDVVEFLVVIIAFISIAVLSAAVVLLLVVVTLSDSCDRTDAAWFVLLLLLWMPFDGMLLCFKSEYLPRKNLD